MYVILRQTPPHFRFSCRKQAAMYMSFGASFTSSKDSNIANTGGFVGPYSILLPDTDEIDGEVRDSTTHLTVPTLTQPLIVALLLPTSSIEAISHTPSLREVPLLRSSEATSKL